MVQSRYKLAHPRCHWQSSVLSSCARGGSSQRPPHIPCTLRCPRGILGRLAVRSTTHKGWLHHWYHLMQLWNRDCIFNDRLRLLATLLIYVLEVKFGLVIAWYQRLVSAQLTARCIDVLVSLDACCWFSRAAQTALNRTPINFYHTEPHPHCTWSRDQIREPHPWERGCYMRKILLLNL